MERSTSSFQRTAKGRVAVVITPLGRFGAIFFLVWFL
jgi:hypothetical protein